MNIRVQRASAVARQWVNEEAGHIPGFAGAFLHGSINELPDDALLPPTSDVDVMVVLAEDHPPFKIGKFIYRDVLLEVSYLPLDQLQSPEQILGNYQLAGSFRTPGIIDDPTGQLTNVQAVVSHNFARRDWVRRRCEDVRRKLERDLQSTNDDRIFPEQVLAWLFGTGKTAHLLLVAGLKNPTVRRRYAAVRELLREYGHEVLHEHLLEAAGCAQISRDQAEQHLAALAEVFDATPAFMKTPFFFASDLRPVSRPLAIDGSRALIEAGDHREAMFWIAVTSSRCQVILHHDAPEPVRERFAPAYRHLLGDLGVASPADLQRLSALTRNLLPCLWDVAEAILAANPAIED